MPRARRSRATAVRARAQRVGKYKPPVWLYGIPCNTFSRSPTCRGRWCTYKRGPHSCGHQADPHWFLWVQVKFFPAFGKNFFFKVSYVFIQVRIPGIEQYYPWSGRWSKVFSPLVPATILEMWWLRKVPPTEQEEVGVGVCFRAFLADANGFCSFTAVLPAMDAKTWPSYPLVINFRWDDIRVGPGLLVSTSYPQTVPYRVVNGPREYPDVYSTMTGFCKHIGWISLETGHISFPHPQGPWKV